MAKMKVYSFEELKDKYLGEVGTPERDQYEAEVQAEINICNLGMLIREEREKQHLTQEQLGAMIGVKKW